MGLLVRWREAVNLITSLLYYGSCTGFWRVFRVWFKVMCLTYKAQLYGLGFGHRKDCLLQYHTTRGTMFRRGVSPLSPAGQPHSLPRDAHLALSLITLRCFAKMELFGWTFSWLALLTQCVLFLIILWLALMDCRALYAIWPFVSCLGETVWLGNV